MEVKEDFITEQKTMQKLLQSLEKTEIHLHLEGLASVETIWTLMKKNKLNYKNITNKEDLKKRFYVKTLEEFLDLFINIIQSSFLSEDDMEYLLKDAGEYLKNNNIVYTEIFFAPSKFLSMGFDFKKMIKILTNGANEIKSKYGREIKYIIDVSRTFGVENAMKNLDLTIKNRTPAIIGIGLGGSEIKGPAKDFAKVFEKAIAENFHVVAHAGEDVGPESVYDTIKYLKAERIGHGISSINDENLLKLLAEKQIPLEICPTSNLFTRKYVKTLEAHPVKPFFEKNLNVTINTDDPTLFSTSLIEEYMTLFKKKIFTKDEIIKLVKNNIYATFLSTAKKDALWKRNLEIIKSSSN
jgi:adenosine deaminase